MDCAMWTDFFMWCSIVNMGLLIFSFLLLMSIGDFVYKVHTKWFPMPKTTFNVVLYSILGVYKILVFVFCIIPWIALEIIG